MIYEDSCSCVFINLGMYFAIHFLVVVAVDAWKSVIKKMILLQELICQRALCKIPALSSSSEASLATISLLIPLFSIIKYMAATASTVCPQKQMSANAPPHSWSPSSSPSFRTFTSFAGNITFVQMIALLVTETDHPVQLFVVIQSLLSWTCIFRARFLRLRTTHCYCWRSWGLLEAGWVIWCAA